MGKVRVLAGTRKGAFILTSDAARKDWKIAGPFFGGWEIYHFTGSMVNPDRLYVSQTSSWFGQIIPPQRRWRGNVDATRHATRRGDDDSRRFSEGRKQQVRLRHFR